MLFNCLLYASDVIIGISCFPISDITFSDIVYPIDILNGCLDVDRAHRFVVLIAKYINDSFQTSHFITPHPNHSPYLPLVIFYQYKNTPVKLITRGEIYFLKYFMELKKLMFH